MDTSGVKPGDIIKVDDGLQWYGEVRSIKPIKAALIGKAGMQMPRTVKPRQVIGHWRKSKATQQREEQRAAE